MPILALYCSSSLAWARLAAVPARSAPHPPQAPGAPRAAAAPRRRPAAAGGASLASVPLDRVIAIVNDEALTQYDVNEQKRVVLGQMKAQNVTPPAADVLEKQLLERLITERVLLQFAKDIRHSRRRYAGRAHDRAHRAGQQALRRRIQKAVEREGIPFAKYRDDIRNEIIIQRLREREVEGRVSVSDAEVDHFLATLNAQSGGDVEYRLAHILVLVPEQASPEQIDTRQRRAETRCGSCASGTDFGQVAAASRMRRTRCRAAISAGARRRACRRFSRTRCAR